MGDKYEHDTERWLRSQAKIYALCQNFGMDATFERCADDVKGMREEIAELKDSLEGAAKSLETISKQAGRDEYMETMTEVRAYAANRAMVASGEFERLRGEG